jgi:hypothetical protein
VAEYILVPHRPQILVTPDKLPILRWPPGITARIDPAELHQLELCTPAVCPRAALRWGAYYKLAANGILYYDEQDRLLGISERAERIESADTSLNSSRQ